MTWRCKFRCLLRPAIEDRVQLLSDLVGSGVSRAIRTAREARDQHKKEPGPQGQDQRSNYQRSINTIEEGHLFKVTRKPLPLLEALQIPT